MNRKIASCIFFHLVILGFLFTIGEACAPPPGSTVPVSSTVTYDGNGNTGGSVPVDSHSPYDSGEEVEVLGNTGNLTRTGYTFSAWNTEADGSGDSYEAGDIFDMPDSAVVLYAQWEANPGVAYLSGGFLSVCEILSNGSFNPCTDSGFTSAQSWSTAFNSDVSTAYVTASFTGKVWVCPVNANHGFGNCADSNGTFSSPIGIVLNSSNTIAYVTENGSGKVQVCNIQSDATFSVCNNSGTSFLAPEGIALNSAGTRAYVVDNDVSIVYLCSINASDGSFTACSNAGNSGVAFAQPEMITLNSAGTFAYIPNQGTSTSFVLVCPINSDGTFGACVDSGGTSTVTFNQPKQVAFNAQGTIAYVSNAESSTPGEGAVYECPVKSDGTFNTCTLVDIGADPMLLSSLWGITIVP